MPGGRTFCAVRLHLEAETALSRPINHIAVTNNIRVRGQYPLAARDCAPASFRSCDREEGVIVRSEIKKYKAARTKTYLGEPRGRTT